MDSVTQIVLGAAIGEIILGKKIGNKAQLLGAIAGTIPDLDVFFTVWINDPISTLQIHRAYSHALFTHIFLALPFAWLSFISFKKRISFMSFYWLWFLGFATHALLDCCTTYGTQFFLPFSNYLVGFNNVSVIDPLYTLPFMILLIVCLFIKRDSPSRIKIAWTAVIYSMIYMGLTLVAKWDAHQCFKKSLKDSNIHNVEISTSPTIFNAVLWAGMAYNDSIMYMSEYSIFQKSSKINLVSFKRNLEATKGFEGEALNTLLWFSQDKYILDKKGEDTLNFFMCKWGRMEFDKEGVYDCFKFYTQLIKTENGIRVHAVDPHFTKDEFKKGIKDIYQRIFL